MFQASVGNGRPPARLRRRRHVVFFPFPGMDEEQRLLNEYHVQDQAASQQQPGQHSGQET